MPPAYSSDAKLQEMYERGLQTGELAAQNYDPDKLVNLLTALSQTTMAAGREAQKQVQHETDAIMDGISRIEASASSGVDAKAMDMWQNYQDNLVELQKSAATVDQVVLQHADDKATTVAGNNPNSDQWRTEYLKSIVESLGDGTGRPFLYGTMKAALGRVGYLDANGALTNESLAKMLEAIRSFQDVTLTDQARRLMENYNSQATNYQGVQQELNNLNTILDATSGKTDDQLKEWYKNNRDQWVGFVHAHDEFRKKTLPALQDNQGTFYLSLQATLAPQLTGTQAFQQGLLEGVAGGAGAAKGVTEDVNYKLARYIASPAAQRTAAEWGFQIGRIVPVPDKATADAIKAKYPTGVYYPQLGGIYVPGPEDRKMIVWAAKREGRTDPRGTLLEQAFGRHYRKETEFVDLELRTGGTIKQPPQFDRMYTIPGSKKDEKIVYMEKENRLYKIENGKLVMLNNEAEAPVRKALRQARIANTLVETTAPDSAALRAAGVSPSEITPTEVETTDKLAHVQVVPARTGDPTGSINIIDPVTGEIRNITAEEVVNMTTVGGGGERQDLRTFMNRVQALNSQRRGAEAANRSLETAAEHPDEVALKNRRGLAYKAAEAVARPEPGTRAPVMQADGTLGFNEPPEPPVRDPAKIGEASGIQVLQSKSTGDYMVFNPTANQGEGEGEGSFTYYPKAGGHREATAAEARVFWQDNKGEWQRIAASPAIPPTSTGGGAKAPALAPTPVPPPGAGGVRMFRAQTGSRSMVYDPSRTGNKYVVFNGPDDKTGHEAEGFEMMELSQGKFEEVGTWPAPALAPTPVPTPVPENAPIRIFRHEDGRYMVYDPNKAGKIKYVTFNGDADKEGHDATEDEMGEFSGGAFREDVPYAPEDPSASPPTPPATVPPAYAPTGPYEVPTPGLGGVNRGGMLTHPQPKSRGITVTIPTFPEGQVQEEESTIEPPAPDSSGPSGKAETPATDRRSASIREAFSGYRQKSAPKTPTLTNGSNPGYANAPRAVDGLPVDGSQIA